MQYNAPECRCNVDHWIEVRLSLSPSVFHPKLHGIIYCLYFTSGGSRISQGAPTPVGGRQPIILQKLLPKTAWKWRNLDPEGALGTPLDPPLLTTCFVVLWSNEIDILDNWKKNTPIDKENLDLLEIYSLFTARWTSGEFNQISLAFAIFAVCVIFNNCISMKTGSYLSVNRFLADLSALKLFKTQK